MKTEAPALDCRLVPVLMVLLDLDVKPVSSHFCFFFFFVRIYASSNSREGKYTEPLMQYLQIYGDNTSLCSFVQLNKYIE